MVIGFSTMLRSHNYNSCLKYSLSPLKYNFTIKVINFGFRMTFSVLTSMMRILAGDGLNPRSCSNSFALCHTSSIKFMKNIIFLGFQRKLHITFCYHLVGCMIVALWRRLVSCLSLAVHQEWHVLCILPQCSRWCKKKFYHFSLLNLCQIVMQFTPFSKLFNYVISFRFNKSMIAWENFKKKIALWLYYATQIVYVILVSTNDVQDWIY